MHMLQISKKNLEESSIQKLESIKYRAVQNTDTLHLADMIDIIIDDKSTGLNTYMNSQYAESKVKINKYKIQNNNLSNTENDYLYWLDKIDQDIQYALDNNLNRTANSLLYDYVVLSQKFINLE